MEWELFFSALSTATKSKRKVMISVELPPSLKEGIPTEITLEGAAPLARFTKRLWRTYSSRYYDTRTLEKDVNGSS
ncbi:hypothetical protein JTE90_002026 [Oedothorax gibbosus]|uniref:Uncharacterized protein n=1 Tax=Oedothorax gibbosus TaxID=931172 RepID=A0AAV6UNN7_9ARAC|nr:hypothetical protein JTE90_002026 [Oedothorax gibbosus]